MSIIEKAASRLDARTQHERAARNAAALDARADSAADPAAAHAASAAALHASVPHPDAAFAAVAETSAPRAEGIPLNVRPAARAEAPAAAQPAGGTFHGAPNGLPNGAPNGSPNGHSAIASAARASAPSSQDDVRHDIDLEKLRSLGMVTPDSGRSAVAEEFRAIKRPLLSQAFSRGASAKSHSNLIMVTSALPGEGKTFCAINLALSIAMELDHTVLLVDADVARPTVLDRLGLQSDVGLLDILHDDKLQLPDVLLRTNVDSLSILPAGRNQRHATELLASHAMTQLLNDIATRYQDRIVIFDSPPLLLTTESRVLAEQMGQIVLVVEAERTTQHNVKNALRQLEGCTNVNLVYNKSKAFLGGNKYGNYYN
ncbi:MAG TPA: XrtA-associated tyrosine autokinase [Burkholderiaceae bacterium]